MTTTLDAPTVHTGPAARPRAEHPGRWWKKLTRAVHGSAAVVLFVALWELVPRFVLDESTRTFLPPLSEDLRALWDLALDGQLADHLLASIGRSAAGFAVAVAVAVPLGLLIGWYRPVARFLQPLLELSRNTAALALLPVFMLLLGIGELSKVTLVVYACVWPVLLNTIAGVNTVDPLLIKAARSLGLSSPRLFRKVILPSAVPTVFTGIRMAASLFDPGPHGRRDGRREGRARLPDQHQPDELPDPADVRRDHRGLGARSARREPAVLVVLERRLFHLASQGVS